MDCKTIVITGGASGIGASPRALAARSLFLALDTALYLRLPGSFDIAGTSLAQGEGSALTGLPRSSCSIVRADSTKRA